MTDQSVEARKVYTVTYKTRTYAKKVLTLQVLAANMIEARKKAANTLRDAHKGKALLLSVDPDVVARVKEYLSNLRAARMICANRIMRALAQNNLNVEQYNDLVLREYGVEQGTGMILVQSWIDRNL